MRSTLALLTLGLLAACGDDGTNHLADAAPGVDGHGSADAAIDGPALPVRLTVTLNGAPAAGVKTYFLNVDSSVVSNTLTGSDGTASAVMVAGGSVTAIEPMQPAAFAVPVTQNQLDTFAGVKPGDDLHLDLGGFGQQPPPVTFQVVVPTDVTASHYQLTTPCGSVSLDPPVLLGIAANNPPVSVTLSRCPAVADVLVETLDTNSTPLSSILVTAAPLANDTTLTVAGPYVALGTTTATYSNIPPDVTFIDTSKGLLSAQGELFSTSAGTSVGSGSATATVALAVPPATQGVGATQVVATSTSRQGTVFDRQTLVDWGSPSDTFTLDVGAALLQDYTTSPTLDLTTNTVTWTPATTGLAPDAVLAAVSFSRSTTTAQDNWVWQIAAPGSTTGAVRYPTLPTDVFDFAPQATDGAFVEEASTAKVSGGYDAIRAHVFATDFLVPPTGTTGHVAVTEIENLKLHRAPARKHGPLAMYTRRK